MFELYWLATLAWLTWLVLTFLEVLRLDISARLTEQAIENLAVIDVDVCDQITLAARELANGEDYPARQRLERLLDEIYPAWRTWGAR